ncbi:MAG TPA: hypothetical protein VMM80_06045 [Bacteroidota bacterium]|nr:hypothetical protein [Bacteroidota bacterium]
MLRTLDVVAALAAALCACGASAAGQTGAGEREDTLAVVAARPVTTTDLVERIDLMPFPGKDRPADRESLNVRALESIVAERLLAAEAAVRGIGADSLTRLRLAGLESAFVRDELYRREVARGVSATPSEIAAGLGMYARQLRVLLARCATEEAARAVSRALRARVANLDSAASAGFGRGLISRDSVTINFGMQDESLEAPAFALNIAHRVSPALFSPVLGWVVLYLLDERSNPACENQSLDQRALTVKSIIEGRKAQVKGVRYMATLLDPSRAEADRGTLELLARAIYGMITDDTTAHRVEGRYMLTPEEIDLLESKLGGSLSRVLVAMPGGPLTLGAAIQAFRLEPFSTPSLGRLMFAAVLNESVKRIAREELIAREGYRRRLGEAPRVQHDLATWRDNWLSHMMLAGVRSPAEPSEEELVRGLIGNARLLDPAYEVNVREIFTDTLSRAQRYRDTLMTGYDMASLARRVSQRRAWAERGGESEFFHVRSFPELGVRALLADTGALVGPVSVGGGYSLFRLIGKRLGSGKGGVTLDSLRLMLRDEIRSAGRQRAVDRLIASLAEKFGVRIDYEKAKAVTLFSHDMFTRRYIGFGGMMNAAPLLAPQWGWVADYLRARESVP